MALTPAMERLLKERREALDEAKQAYEDAVVEAYKAGGSLNEIGKAMGMTHRGIGKLLERLGVRKPWRSIVDANRELDRREALERGELDEM